MTGRRAIIAACLLALVTSTALATATDELAVVRYGRDVRPLLSDRCFQCHGADPSSRQAKLRLDIPEGATADRGDYAAIVPGDLDASELWARITSDDPEMVMPPPGAKKRPLSEADRQAIARWISQGAEYEPHWAFVAPRSSDMPIVGNPTWPRGSIDVFVLARMEAEGIAPSPPADAATLARRVSLDLTGLPPTVAELDEFLAACAPHLDAEARARGEVPVDDDAYLALVDRLLTEEPWRSRVAERLAVPWLDAARYADTSGIHTDNGRQMWLWRDWVLAAFRDNMPFDRFVTEQLAGDLLPDATLAQRIASGFNRNHVTTDEGGAIPEEYLVEYAVDRVNTTSAVFLGLTAGCARCHDHKYDPVTQDDYYGLLAYFNSNDEPGLYTQTEDSNRAYEPFLEVPSPDQQRQLDALDAEIGKLTAELEAPIPGEEDERATFLRRHAARAGLDWTTPRVRSAASSDEEVFLVPQPDGALLAEGPHPMQEDYEVVLATDRTDLRALLLEALSVPGQAGAGRASHGNAVISRLTLDVKPADAGDDAWRPVPLSWAWSDHTQTNFDHDPTRVLDDDHALGWAVDGNDNAGPRNLLLLSEAPFGDPSGSLLRVRLAFRSPYAEHSLGHIRFRVSPVSDTSGLPVALGRWWRAGPFTDPGPDDRERMYATTHGPETGASLDRAATYGPEQRQWSFDGALADGQVSSLGETPGVTYVGRTIWSPDARELHVALGSDDGLVVFHDGEPVFENRVDRGAALGQDQVTLSLHPGLNGVVLKIVNTGGATGFAWETTDRDDVLRGELGSALLPADAVTEEQDADFRLAWRRQRFDGYRALDDLRNAARERRAQLETEVPRTMVMSELPEPRETFVLTRGQYDHPDENRPVTRATPAFLPPLPDDAPADRRGLARWLVSPEHPLFARVTVNRFWEMIFGAGLVRTSQDFGLQGSWPSHPELLDTLAVEFRESGWDVRGLLRRFVTSATYRQASVVRPDVATRDPENALLARFPRRRLSAEQIRDLALATSGLLVERFGGPSVKPYQPEGLWREVAMLASNTREFMRDDGDALWRRSLYTYWKRAVPPPALLTLDAPTRESCTVSRQITNTPLQALVLWNDEQFVEAARKLAERVLTEAVAPDTDDARITWLLRTCTGRAPRDDELDLMRDALGGFRDGFMHGEADPAALTSVGAAPRDESLDATELAAWTLLANAALNLHETITQD
jgi:mono/diheme cytochrome c family protein